MRWFALVILVGCGSVPDNSQRDAASDAPDDVAIEDSADAGLGPWGTPVPVTSLNTANADQDATLTEDQLEIVFSSTRPGGNGMSDLWTTTRATKTAAWNAPKVIPNVNSAMGDDRAWLSPDGLRMYFTSDRGGTGNDIYATARVSRTSPWAAPTIVNELASASDDEVGGLSVDELMIVFSSDRGGVATGRDLYIASRATKTASFGIPAAVAALDTAELEAAAAFASNGAALYFIRANALWRAERTGTTYGNPVKIDELIDTAPLGDPWVSQDERTLYFTRNTGSGVSLELMMTTR
ncbi:MAG TPA: hypothetical protein VGM39_07940 [Kofleriaceae bacterium]|jgi:Tol biopolymer transport system component